MAFELSLLDAGDVEMGCQLFTRGRGKGLDNKTRRMFPWLQMFGMFGMRCYHRDINIVNIIIQHFNRKEKLCQTWFWYCVDGKGKKKHFFLAGSEFGLKLVV